MKKLLSLFISVIIALSLSLPAFAAGKDDYTTFKYGKVQDIGANTVRVYGKGVMGTTVSQGSSFASAVTYKKQVNAKNINFNLEFVKDYGQGEGKQSGWYAFNLSKTPNWFSSVGAILKKENLSGVVVIMKLDANNKKKCFLEISRYSAGSGFQSIFGSTIEINIKNDWKCHVAIENGTLEIDGNMILDLSDALTVSLGSENKGYLGFGGLSESNYDIEMNVQYDGSADVSETGGTVTSKPTSSESDSKPTQSSASKNEPSKSNSNTTSVASVDTDASKIDSIDASSENQSSTTEDSESSENSIVLDNSSEETSSVKTGDNVKNSGSKMTVIIIIVTIVVLAAGAGTGCFYFKKKKSDGSVNTK